MMVYIVSVCVCVCVCVHYMSIFPFSLPSFLSCLPPPPPPPPPPSVDRQRLWFTTEDAIIQTSRRPLKQHYLIAACKQTQLHSQQILQPLSSPSLPPLSSSSYSISYRTTLLSSLLLTCTLVLCVGLYNIIIV